jgi:thiol-disulfide isomerase/thioredoxin
MALLEFFGTECPHCVRMAALVERLEKEENVTVEKYEVWHNEENARRLETVDKGNCGGVPYFHNTTTGKFLCGETDYETLKAWAKGE